VKKYNKTAIKDRERPELTSLLLRGTLEIIVVPG